MTFLQFAIYFFTCQITYDIVSSIVRSYFLKKEFEKIRKQLNEVNNVWN